MLIDMEPYRVAFRSLALAGAGVLFGASAAIAQDLSVQPAPRFMGQSTSASSSPYVSFDAYGMHAIETGISAGGDQGTVLFEVAPNTAGVSQGLSGAAAPQLRAGYWAGRAYGFLSFSSSDGAATDLSAENGPAIGVGLRISLNRVLQLTGEIQHLEDTSEQDFEDDRFSLTAAFRF